MRPNFWIIIALAFALPLPALATGSFAGNGADHLGTEFRSAWFLGDKAIRWCLHLAPEAGITERYFRSNLDKAVGTWNEYLAKKEINQSGDSRIPSLALNLVPMPACDGSEDLRFEIGTNTAEITKYRAQYKNPVAFSQSLSYDETSGRGRGFVWLKPGNSPDWNNYGNLRGILLHELGHILGCEHVEGTVMDQAISETLLLPEPRSHEEMVKRQMQLAQIDFSKELFFCKKCGVSLLGQSPGSDPATDRSFQKLFGRKPGDRAVRMGFLHGNDAENYLGNFYIGAETRQISKLTGDVKLEGAMFEIYFDADSLVEQRVSDAQIFKRQYRGQTKWLTVPGYTRMGVLKTKNPRTNEKDGGELPILYYRNIGQHSILRLFYMDGGKAMPLFEGKSPDQWEVPEPPMGREEIRKWRGWKIWK